MEAGLDPRVWLTLIGVCVVFFAIPGALIEYDRRKRRRDDTDSA